VSKTISVFAKQLEAGSKQRDKVMPDEFCWFERMQALIKDHEKREMQIYTELRDEMQRYHYETNKEQKQIMEKLSELQRQFDRSYVVVSIMKYLVPVGGIIGGAVWWLKDHVK